MRMFEIKRYAKRPPEVRLYLDIEAWLGENMALANCEGWQVKKIENGWLIIEDYSKIFCAESPDLTAFLKRYFSRKNYHYQLLNEFEAQELIKTNERRLSHSGNLRTISKKLHELLSEPQSLSPYLNTKRFVN